MYDYQGRSYLHIPQDVGVNLRSSDAPDKCYLPKKQIHVWSGHTKVSGIGHIIAVSLKCPLGCFFFFFYGFNPEPADLNSEAGLPFSFPFDIQRKAVTVSRLVDMHVVLVM